MLDSKSSCQSRFKWKRVRGFPRRLDMFVCQSLLVRYQSLCQLGRLPGEQARCNCFADISPRNESIAAGTVDKEPLTHDHAILTESVSSASGAREKGGNLPAAAARQCVDAGKGMPCPGRLCLYLSLNAPPVVERAGETLSLPVSYVEIF